MLREAETVPLSHLWNSYGNKKLRHTVKGLCSQLYIELEEDSYYNILAGIKNAGFNFDEIKSCLSRMVVSCRSARMKCNAEKILLEYENEDTEEADRIYAEEIISVMNRMKLKYIITNKKEYDEIEKYYRDMESEEKEYDILFDEICDVCENESIMDCIIMKIKSLHDEETIINEMKKIRRYLTAEKYRYENERMVLNVKYYTLFKYNCLF